jgi:hypothetical protein
MKALGILRLTLIALLLVSTTAFLVGVLAERSSDDEHHESAAVVQDLAEGTHNEAAEPNEAGDAETNEAAQGRDGKHREPSDKGEAAARETGEHDAEASLLGIDPESTPLLVIAVAAGLSLTALATSRMGTSRAFLVVVALAALLWATLDIREIAHQIDESRSSIAAIAAVVAALHLAAAAVASFLAKSPQMTGRRKARTSLDRPVSPLVPRRPHGDRRPRRRGREGGRTLHLHRHAPRRLVP